MVSDERLIEVIGGAVSRWGRPVAGTAEIADVVGMARQNVNRRLERLRDEDRVEKDKIGGTSVWWVEPAD